MGYYKDDEMYKIMRKISNPYSLKNMAYERVVQSLYQSIKNKFGLEFRVSSMEMVSAFDWISKHDKKWDRHVSNPQMILSKNEDSLTGKSYKYIVDKQYIFKLERATYCLVMAGPPTRRNDDNSQDDKPSYLIIYIFGKKMFKYAKQLSKELTSNKKEFLTLYKVNGSKADDGRTAFEVLATDLHTRPLDTLFFNDNVKDNIIDHIDRFLSNEPIYKERSLLYKTGILLYGDPGTGKSSLATSIATKYGYDVISIDMTTFNTLDSNALVEAINADNDRYIVLMEDIDAVIKNRNNNIDKEDDKNINKLLQFLDSSSSPTNVIFIATTNYVDTLDSALIRDGRFDIKCKVDELHVSKIDDMCKSFNISDEDISDIKEQLKHEGKKTINQSRLQNMILKCIEKRA